MTTQPVTDERIAEGMADLAWKLDPPKPWGLANWTMVLTPEETLSALQELRARRQRDVLMERLAAAVRAWRKIGALRVAMQKLRQEEHERAQPSIVRLMMLREQAEAYEREWLTLRDGVDAALAELDAAGDAPHVGGTA